MQFQFDSRLGSIQPLAARTLGALGNTPLFHTKRGQRHPSGMYCFTLNEVLQKIEVLLDLLDEAKRELPHLKGKPQHWEQRILDAMDHVLDSIIQHLDAYKTIISSLFEDSTAKPAKKVWESLKKEIRWYRDHVAQIVNLIKHEQRRLSPIYFHGVGTFSLGYFVEGVLNDGAIGPDPKIHRGSNVAISFNRDLPFHIYGLFSCSASLANHLHDVCGVIPSGTGEVTHGQLERIVKRISALPLEFFPDELTKPLPVVRSAPNPNGEGFKVTIEMPSRRFRARSVPTASRVAVTWHRDGASRKFKLPYLELIRKLCSR